MKISRTKVVNFFGIVTLYFLVLAVQDVFAQKYFNSVLNLVVSLLYYWLIKLEVRASSERQTFFTSNKLPYYWFAFCGVFDLWVLLSNPFSITLTIRSMFGMFVSIYSVYILIKPFKLIGLDLEIYKLVKRMIN